MKGLTSRDEISKESVNNNRLGKIFQSEELKGKRKKMNEWSSETCGTPSWTEYAQGASQEESGEAEKCTK
jgi:hypothetical protein